MCRIMVIRSPCAGMTRPGVGLSAPCRRRRPRWEGTLTRTVPGMPSAVPGPHGDGVLGEPADQRVLVGLRGDDRVAGVLVGTELRHEPAIVKLCGSAFEAVWDSAVPHEDYRPA
jgi:hypothetical protein